MNAYNQSWNVFNECWCNRRYYAISIGCSIILALIVSLSIPKEYASQIKLGDEPKELDIIIGNDNIRWWLNSFHREEGIKIESIYSQIIYSQEFIDKILDVEIEDETTFADYLKRYHRQPWWIDIYDYWQQGQKDYNERKALEEKAKELISYEVSEKYSTLIIKVSATDPVIAGHVVNSVVTLLQQHINTYSHNNAKQKLQDLNISMRKAKEEYDSATQALKTFSDSHNEIRKQEEQTVLRKLQSDVDIAYKNYSNLQIEYTRTLYLSKRNEPIFSVIQNATIAVSPYKPSVVIYVLVFSFIAIIITTWYILFKKHKELDTKINLFAGNYFAPWNITITIWGGIFLLMTFQGDLLYPLSQQFYISISLWIPIICISSFITYQLLPHTNENNISFNIPINANMLIFKVLFYITVIITPLYVYQILKIVTQFDSSDMLENIRILALYGDENHGFLSYSYIINQSLLVMGLWLYPKISKWYLFVIFCCNLLSAFAIIEKGCLFFIILCTIFVLFEKGIIKIRTIVFSFLAIIVIFFFINGYRGSGDVNDIAEVSQFLDFFAIYILSPPVAFGKVTEDISTQFGAHTFEVIYLFLQRFGYDVEVHQKTQEFVFVPLPTNVYTIMQPFFQDWGYKGVAFFAFVYGVFTGWIYRLFRNGSNIGRCIYTFIAEVLVLQFYQENIMLSLITFIQFCFFIIITTQNKIKIKLF